MSITDLAIRCFAHKLTTLYPSKGGLALCECSNEYIQIKQSSIGEIVWRLELIIIKAYKLIATARRSSISVSFICKSKDNNLENPNCDAHHRTQYRTSNVHVGYTCIRSKKGGPKPPLATALTFDSQWKNARRVARVLTR